MKNSSELEKKINEDALKRANGQPDQRLRLLYLLGALGLMVALVLIASYLN